MKKIMVLLMLLTMALMTLWSSIAEAKTYHLDKYYLVGNYSQVEVTVIRIYTIPNNPLKIWKGDNVPFIAAFGASGGVFSQFEELPIISFRGFKSIEEAERVEREWPRYYDSNTPVELTRKEFQKLLGRPFYH